MPELLRIASRVSLRRRAIVLLSLVVVLAVVPAAAQVSTIIVRLRGDASVKQVLAGAKASAGASHSIDIRRAVDAFAADKLLSAYALDRYHVLTVPSERLDDVVAGLRADDGVEYAGINRRYRVAGTTSDPRALEQWAHRRIELDDAWKRTLGSDSIVIGFIDTGIDYRHPDLVQSLWINSGEDHNRNGTIEPWPTVEFRASVRGDFDGVDNDGNGYIDDVVGFDFVDQTTPNVGDWTGRDGNPFDEHGHGTTIAGVMSAARDNAIGIAGVAPRSPLMTLRAFDASGNAEDDDVAAAIVYAAMNRVRVLNLSFGDVFYSPLMHDAIRFAVARGVVVVASAGNEGSGDPHYPSSYPEVIAVSMTDSNDLRNELSNYGSQISVAAPGVEVLSTAVDSSYRLAGGTSISAPYVAGIAALVLSLHPTWSPEEVRGVIELSADDRGIAGWDEFYGAGRVNARRALDATGPVLIAINTPSSHDGIGADTVVSIVGSAHSPLLDSWQLYVAPGEIPDASAWIALGEASSEGRVYAKLGELSTSGFPDTTLTLRLVLRQTNGRVGERRARIVLDRSAPRILSSDVRPVWHDDVRAVAVTVNTDDRTRLYAMVRLSGSGESFRQFSLEPERTGLVRTHYLVLGPDDLQRETPYDIYVIATNAAGDTAMIGSAASPLTVTRSDEAFPERGFTSLSHSLPYGFTLNETVALYDSTDRTLALNRFDGFRFGKLVMYSYRDGRFVARDSLDRDWLPKGFGDSDGDGLRELLVQSGAATRIYEQLTPGGSVLASVIFDDANAGDQSLARTLGGEFADVDGDGRDELIGRTDPRVLVVVNGDTLPPHYFIAKHTNSGFSVIARLMNPTRAGFGSAVNQYGAPNAIVADVNSDGRTDILIGDDDADFLLFSRDPVTLEWRLAWSEENEGKGVTELLTHGDLDGDGAPEVVTGFRSELNLTNRAGDYDPPFWTVRVRRFSGPDFASSVVWDDRFAYVRPTDPFRAGASVGQLDDRTGDELALSVFPGMFVLRWSAVERRLEPLWFRYVSINNQPIIADFDRDGISELGVGDGQRITFHQYDRTSRGPDVPGGLNGWATSDSSVHLEWTPVAGAETYNVYRGDFDGSGAIRLVRIGSTASTSFEDTGGDTPETRLRPNERFVYTVTAVSSATSPPEGDFAMPIVVYTHMPARITDASAESDSSIVVTLSVEVREELYRAAAFDLVSQRTGEHVEVSSIAQAGARRVVLQLAEVHPEDSIIVKLTRQFRDAYGSPGDTTTTVGVRMPAREQAGQRFIATRAQLGESGGGRVIVIWFNAPVDPVSGEDASNYVLAPADRMQQQDAQPDAAITAARIDPSDPRRVLLSVHRGFAIGALGRNYSVTIRNVRSVDGRTINNGGESVVGFSFESPDLSSLRVYPHPYSISRDGTVMFAGLPRDARVTIVTREGRLLRTLREVEHNGGVEWDGRDDNGARVSSGVYLYRVTMRVGAETIESELQKIAVVD